MQASQLNGDGSDEILLRRLVKEALRMRSPTGTFEYLEVGALSA
jgi:hypothetical protein